MMDERYFHQEAKEPAASQSRERLRLLIDTGLLLSSERNLDVVVQAALDAGLALSGAAFGAFFYSTDTAHGDYKLYKVSGVDPAVFAYLPMPRLTPLLAPAFSGHTALRSDDILADPRYGRNNPVQGLPPGHLPLRSYLAVPVKTRGEQVLGALLYGHPEVAVFTQEAESLVATVAAQAAVAMDNARLAESLSREVAVAEDARAEQRSTDRRLRQALDAAQLGTWTWDSHSGLIDFDERAAELFGVAPHVPVLRRDLWASRVHPEDRTRSPEDLDEVLKAGGKYSAEYRIVQPDGTVRWISASAISSHAEGSAGPSGMTGTLQDITPRKVQEHTLRESEKLAATGRLAATIAHEINNPLEAVTNLIYLAKTDPATPPAIERMLETADSELARVSQIAQQTLGFYRDTTRPVTIDMNDLIQAVVNLFERKLTGKRLRCVLDVEPGLSVVGLQGEIRQVISNLLVNAIDASGTTGSSIRIRGRHRHRNGRRGVSVLIADQGTGIPADVRGRLFTPFVTTKQSLGTGLGLWVTRGMVEKHGGSVRFRSRVETPAGTVFCVHIPVSSHPHFVAQTTAVLQ